MSLAFTLLWRQWRTRNLRLMFISLVVAMATLLNLQLLTTRIEHSVARSAKELLAADVRVETTKPLSDAVQKAIEPFTERASRVIEFQSMAYTTGADEGQLAQVKAVEAGYPLWPGIGWGAKGAQWPA